ncbi:unnamed protein product [Linum trigynum]|uniref:Uncharacterized protein n=1 Tax=Linum trigynum TaxID=586398 RepID=A0AAV2GIC0_9ROSI
MASACVNNISVSSESFPPPGTYSSYGWLSPRISFSREDDSLSKHHHHKQPPPSKPAPAPSPPPPPPATEIPPPDNQQQQDLFPDFEFRLDDPVAMLPADELFSDGKLVPMQVTSSNSKPSSSTTTSAECLPGIATTTETAEAKSGRRMEIPVGINSTTDQYLFSPKAPRCSSRWKEILGLKKFYQNNSSKAASFPSSSSSSSSSSCSSSSSNNNQKSLRHFLHRSSKSCNSCGNSSSNSSLDGSLSLPLLKADLDCESSVSFSSSRLSLSSSSSSHEHEDLPRLSLDSEKPNAASNLSLTFNSLHSPNPFVLNRNQNPPRMRMVKPRAAEIGGETRVGRSPIRRATTAAGAGGDSGGESRGVSIDSPRLNSSGKIVFQSLERSSSSPSSFNGGPRHKHRGMERSYSANVRVTPVLNVPVCSLMGSSKSGSVFGFFSSSSPQKRDGGGVNNYNSKGQPSFSRGNRAAAEHKLINKRDGLGRMEIGGGAPFDGEPFC